MFLHQFNATESEAKYGSVGVMTSGYVSKYGCFFFYAVLLRITTKIALTKKRVLKQNTLCYKF